MAYEQFDSQDEYLLGWRKGKELKLHCTHSPGRYMSVPIGRMLQCYKRRSDDRRYKLTQQTYQERFTVTSQLKIFMVSRETRKARHV